MSKFILDFIYPYAAKGAGWVFKNNYKHGARYGLLIILAPGAPDRSGVNTSGRTTTRAAIEFHLQQEIVNKRLEANVLLISRNEDNPPGGHQIFFPDIGFADGKDKAALMKEMGL